MCKIEQKYLFFAFLANFCPFASTFEATINVSDDIIACCEFPKMFNGDTWDCVDEKFGEVLWDVGLPGEKSVKKDVAKEFHWVESQPACEGRHLLRPEEAHDFDTWFLAKNGLIFLPHEEIFIDNDHHCVAVDDKNQQLLVVRCSDAAQPKRSRISGIGMFLSIPFLLATFIVYAVIPELRNVHGLSLMSYVGSHAVSYTFLGAVQLISSNTECTDAATTQCYNKYFCTAAAYISYFTFMLGFFWLNTMCFDIFWTLRNELPKNAKSTKKDFLYYCIYAWGMALCLTIVTFLVDISGISDAYKPGMYFSQKTCFLKNDPLVQFIYLYSIILVLICMNITFFGVTAYRIKKVQAESAAVGQDDNYRFMLYLKLFIIMGVTWSMEFISWIVGSNSSWFFVTDVINCLQGFLVFLLVVCNKTVRGKVGCKKVCI